MQFKTEIFVRIIEWIKHIQKQFLLSDWLIVRVQYTYSYTKLAPMFTKRLLFAHQLSAKGFNNNPFKINTQIFDD